MKKGLTGFLYRILCGFFLGISVVAPGVSGSVMAVMMGIYRELIEIISNPFKNFKQNFIYVLPMALGAGISLVLSVILLSFAFKNYPAQSMLLFSGLIAGSIYGVYKQARSIQFKRRYLISLFIALAAALAVGIIGRGENTVSSANIGFWYLCLAGALSGLLSLIPGMSVSLVLMLLGVYEYLLGTAANAAAQPLSFILTALPVGISFIIGMVALSRVIKLTFERFPGLAQFAVLGFMCGSLAAVLPLSLPTGFWALAACALFLLTGLFISLCFQLLAKKFAAATRL